MTDEGVVNLCLVIVERAIEDYKSILKNSITDHRLTDLERFFRSNWCNDLTFGKMDVESIIQARRKAVKDGKRKKL